MEHLANSPTSDFLLQSDVLIVCHYNLPILKWFNWIISSLASNHTDFFAIVIDIVFSIDISIFYLFAYLLVKTYM